MRYSLRWIFAFVIAVGLLFPISANAAPNLIEVQGRVRELQEQATTAAEGAQEAKVQLAKLKKTLETVQQQASQQGASVTALNKSIGVIANERYKSGPLSQSLELLFSTDPTLYLSAAGSLEAVTRQKTADLKKFSVATQRLTATSLTVEDKLAMVKAAEAKFTRQLALANSKLKEAEALLAKLTAAERERLAKLTEDEEDADQQKSLSDASKYATLSGRAGTAIKYALAQIGDKYVFGADGLTYWDCSGLTMRAFAAAGVSLPHSSRAQYRYGKAVAKKDLRPGDLVFFGKPISHVGIYLGPDRMLHAPRSGSRVKIANMNMGKKPYIGARRL
ncbi:MAG: peptidoglycan endopeptidase [Actinobacteria bacterium]|nr:peptidoglycan endopeptidase [Actinomycetota bacterium]